MPPAEAVEFVGTGGRVTPLPVEQLFRIPGLPVRVPVPHAAPPRVYATGFPGEPDR